MDIFKNRQELKQKAEEYSKKVEAVLIEKYGFSSTAANMLVGKYDLANFLREDPNRMELSPEDFAIILFQGMIAFYETETERY